MFALTGGTRFWSRAALEGAADSRVMPRVLRRPLRFLMRFASGNVAVPNWANAAANTGLIAAAIAFGTVQGGHGPAVVQAAAGQAGFAIEDVRITGNSETSEIDILGALGLDGWTSLVGFDAESARQSIASLPWVQSVSVRKTYPSGLDVDIHERAAHGLWQNGDVVSVIDADGAVIAPYADARFASLPLLAGEGAPLAAEALLTELKQAPVIAGKAVAYIRVGGRRWDLRLASGLNILLPEEGAGAALAALEALDAENGILSRDVAAIDLRLTDRVTVRLSADGAKAHDAAFDSAIKGAKKKEKRT